MLTMLLVLNITSLKNKSNEVYCNNFFIIFDNYKL